MSSTTSAQTEYANFFLQLLGALEELTIRHQTWVQMNWPAPEGADTVEVEAQLREVVASYCDARQFPIVWKLYYRTIGTVTVFSVLLTREPVFPAPREVLECKTDDWQRFITDVVTEHLRRYRMTRSCVQIKFPTSLDLETDVLPFVASLQAKAAEEIRAEGQDQVVTIYYRRYLVDERPPLRPGAGSFEIAWHASLARR
ncbi:MAG: hypothetical protein HOE53_04690 [Candidatus Magasanikbacteria bacterium]|jgi:hypothetical protein|nr:hypothetical protein [Candidatus Magasanikbacteria bacterium]